MGGQELGKETYRNNGKSMKVTKQWDTDSDESKVRAVEKWREGSAEQ